MDVDIDLRDESGPLFEDVSQYMRLLGNLSILLYLTNYYLCCWICEAFYAQA